jgi:hypothetical protein
MSRSRSRWPAGEPWRIVRSKPPSSPPLLPGSAVSGGEVSRMPGRVGVSSDQAVDDKGESVDGSSSPPRSGGDGGSPGVDAAVGVANPQRGLLQAMRPVAPFGLPAISPTLTVGEQQKPRCGSEKPWIEAEAGEARYGASRKEEGGCLRDPPPLRSGLRPDALAGERLRDRTICELRWGAISEPSSPAALPLAVEANAGHVAD